MTEELKNTTETTATQATEAETTAAQATEAETTAAQATTAETTAAQAAANGDGRIDELAALQARVAQLEKESAEYKDQWLRAAADYKNFKRRTEQERSDLIRGASAGLLLKLLPVVDDLERALDSATPDVAATPWYAGFKLIPQKLRTVLDSEGVTPIEAIGQEFGPNLHEAVIYEAAEGQEGKVVGELQKGYKLRDRVLRPTMVKVGQG